MKLAPVLTLIALAAAPLATAAAATAGRFVLDDGRASVVFPHGAPLKMTMTQEGARDVAPERAEQSLARMLPAQTWMERDGGQTYSVMVTDSRKSSFPLTQHCPRTTTFQDGRRSSTHSCRLVDQGGTMVAEHRTERSDGGLMVMRSFEAGDHRYAVSYMRVSDELAERFAKMSKTSAPSASEGEAFLNSFRLEKSPASH